MFADVSMTDLAVRFPVRSIERTVQVLLTYANARCKKNLFGKVPRDIALAYANQIIPEATLSTASSGAGSGLLADGKLFERLMHPISVDWDVVAELLFDPTGMPRVTRMAAK
ncbi:hypothetical protein EON67_06300 [archaeon]|nr:MAG: hypothetical protein EON67_06300 [archaeon]